MAKRGNSEGSVYQREDGRWVAAVTIRGADGLLKRVTRYAGSQNAARRLLTTLKTKQDAGRPIQFENMTLRQWLEVWLEDWVKPRRSPSTYCEYHRILKSHLPADVGAMQLPRVPAERLQQVFNELAVKKGRTAELLRAILRAAFNRALKLRRVEVNPVTATDPVGFSRKEGAILNVDQITKLVADSRAAEDRFQDLWVILISLGLRKGEALGLKPVDVDLEERRVHIRRTLARIKLPGEKKGQWVEKSPKTEKSKRSLKLPQIVVDAFVRQMARRDADQQAAGRAWKGTPFLFCTETGEPIHSTEVSKALTAACKRSGVPQVRVHDLRHCCGSFLGANGVPTIVIMDILGHTQFVTAKRYIHTSEEVQEAALGKVGAILEGRKTTIPAADTPNGVAVTVAVN